MGSILARFLLFLSSYSPLALILAVLLLGESWVISCAFLVLAGAGIGAVFIYLRTLEGSAPFKVDVAGIQRRDYEVVGYLVGYVIPFLAVPFESWQQGVGLLLFLAVICILHVKLNVIHINPILTLSGYHLYEVTTQKGGVHSLITSRRIALGDTLHVVKSGEDILFERRT